jgi:hypothetical protein
MNYEIKFYITENENGEYHIEDIDDYINKEGVSIVAACDTLKKAELVCFQMQCRF